MRTLTHKNFIFRFHHCGLTREEAAELCFVSVREVTKWDNGKTIPPICKRLMRWAKGRDLGGNFAGWKLEDNGRWLVSAEGHRMAPQQILNAVYIEHLYRVNKTRHENIRQLHVLRELRKAKRL